MVFQLNIMWLKFVPFSIVLIFNTSFIGAQPYMQTDNPFRSPVDFEILLSGNFAELRGSHFHTGIDIKTKGTIGHNIYAIDDGYVSRIKVSPFGYGNALYIRHNNGYTSVYAHLNRFNIQIEQYVRNEQYRIKKFAVNLYPEEDVIKVNKGDVIGLSGNSGGSMGPHLHFEIRKTESEKPQNPLFWDFDIIDNIPPRFHHLIINPLSKNANVDGKHSRVIFNLDREKSNYFLKGKPVITVSDTVGVVAHVNDYLNNTHNRCGVYELKMFVNNKLFYHLKMDDLSFAENRYILSHIDYDLKIDSRIKAHKCYVDEGNHFSAYEYIENDGRLFVAPGERKYVTIEATDVKGNKADLKFTLLGVPSKDKPAVVDYDKILYAGQINTFEKDDIKLKFPTNALYRKVYFKYKKKPAINGLYSDIHAIHTYKEPLHKRYSISIKAKNIPFNYRDKLFLASVSADNEISSISSHITLDGDCVKASVRSFGSFAVAVDTVLPEIVPLNITENKDMSRESKISFKIKDELTGIDNYNGYINGQWVLFQYDAKNDLIFYEFDEYIPIADTYVLKLIVTDRKKNTAVKTISFKKPDLQSNKN
jgi:hypothetical protein